MDVTDRRLQLPSLSYLDAEKAKVKDDVYFPRHASITSNPSLSNTSPTSHYSSGPTPPYSQSYSTAAAQYSTTAWQNGQPDVKTSPDSRRSSGDEKEEIGSGTRQSLPPLSHVLAHEPSRSYHTSQPPVPSLRSVASAQPKASPSPESARAYAMDPPHLPSKPTAAGYGPSEPTKPAHAPVQEPQPLLHNQTPAKIPRTSAYPRSQDSSSTAEQQYKTSVGSAAAPSFGPGYVPYSPQYGNPPPPPPPPPPGVSSGPIYQPSTAFGAPPVTTGWKNEAASRSEERPTGPVYHGESVKRHLESYDMETSFSEIAVNSASLADFARRYCDQMYRHQRLGAPLTSLPSLVEIDDMMMKSRSEYDALLTIREAVQREQAVYEQRAADQRQQQKLYGDQPAAQSDHHHQQQQQTQQQRSGEDGKGLGFPGADTKKRRGRAAPPGRCHSCNRAETPEWRRGPDGARTLCNACGLHYAKLTRKSNHAKQSSALTSSNLRPKENAA